MVSMTPTQLKIMNTLPIIITKSEMSRYFPLVLYPCSFIDRRKTTYSGRAPEKMAATSLGFTVLSAVVALRSAVGCVALASLWYYKTPIAFDIFSLIALETGYLIVDCPWPLIRLLWSHLSQKVFNGHWNTHSAFKRWALNGTERFANTRSSAAALVNEFIIFGRNRHCNWIYHFRSRSFLWSSKSNDVEQIAS